MKKLLILLLLGVGTGVSAQTIVQQFVSIGSAGQVVDLDLPKPSAKGSMIIAMPTPLSAGVKVVSVTDNAPAGGNIYRQVTGATASAGGKDLEIWYCENCNPDATELKFHLSDFAKGSIDTVLEVAGLEHYAALDGDGAHVSDGVATSDGSEIGPSIKTTANDFVIARYTATAMNHPTGVTPAAWTYQTTHIFVPNGPPGTYQPTLTGGKAGNSFAMGIAAFKVAKDAAPAADAKPLEHE